MGQTAPRGAKASDDLEGGQEVTVANIPVNSEDLDVQEPVFGSPIDSEFKPSPLSLSLSSPFLLLPSFLQLLVFWVHCLELLM